MATANSIASLPPANQQTLEPFTRETWHVAYVTTDGRHFTTIGYDSEEEADRWRMTICRDPRVATAHVVSSETLFAE